MDYLISHTSKSINTELHLPASKSISNRTLIIQALCHKHFKIKNLSDSSDTQVLLRALKSDSKTINIGDAGTSMRFLTAFLSQQEGTYVLTGSKRMKERPIYELVNALNTLGANIEYLEKEGYPPLKIKGNKIQGNNVKISSAVSSQYISALLLIAPTLKNGLTIQLKGDLLSKPYIEMTLSIMQYFGIKSQWKNNSILIKPQNYIAKDIEVEADWSALAFILEAMLLSESAEVKIKGLYKQSWQGDAHVLKIFERLGLKYQFSTNKLILKKSEIQSIENYNINLKNQPDLAQAYCCTLVGKQYTACITGLKNLQFKESHRLKALQLELKKIGQRSEYSEDSFTLIKSEIHPSSNIFETHKDHRMAMCLAPLAMLFELTIKSVEVVNKSYPLFWEDMQKMGFTISPLTHSDN